MKNIGVLYPCSGRLVGAVVLCVFLTSAFAGCGVIHGVDRMVATDSRKVALLNEQIAKFNRALYWGSVSEASQFVAVEKQQEFYKQTKDEMGSQRFVGIDVNNVAYNDDDGSAEVEVTVRYYAVPTYLVESRTEVQEWQFHRVSGGWLYYGKEIVERLDASNTAAKNNGDVRGKL